MRPSTNDVEYPFPAPSNQPRGWVSAICPRWDVRCELRLSSTPSRLRCGSFAKSSSDTDVCLDSHSAGDHWVNAFQSSRSVSARIVFSVDAIDVELPRAECSVDEELF